jgi:hypothetical protein
MKPYERRGEPTRVLLLDTTQYLPSSPLFAEALQRFQATGTMAGLFVDEAPTAKRLARSVLGRVALKMGRWKAVGFGTLHKQLVAEAVAFVPDVVLVVKGAHVPRSCLRQIKRRTGAVLVNFATDDPFNARTSSRQWLSTLPEYDIVCTPRRANIGDLQALGIPEVHFVPFGYKPDVHFPETPRDAAEQARFHSDVCFIGGADADRLVYFENLVRDLPGVKLALYGGYWNRSPRLAPFWRGFAVGREFRLAVGGAAISVNLVRRANRDDHVMRTFEIPACGGCMLTEPTSTHRKLFREGREAFFFDSPTSFVRSIQSLLDDPGAREHAAHAARVAIQNTGHRYDERLLTIVQLAVPQHRTETDRPPLNAVSL